MVVVVTGADGAAAVRAEATGAAIELLICEHVAVVIAVADVVVVVASLLFCGFVRPGGLAERMN